MRTIRWRESALAFIVAVLALASPRWVHAQERPDEETPIIDRAPADPDAKGSATEPETDDPNARLEAQRIAWGQVTSKFRVNAFKEGLETLGSQRRGQEVLVRAGAALGQHRSDGRRLRAERQLHGPRARQRARAHHPSASHEPRHRLFPDLRRRPVADEQLEVERHALDAADRRSADHGRRLGRVRRESEHPLPRPRAIRTTRSWSAAR